MKKLIDNIFIFSILLPQFALLYAFLNFSLNIISLIICLVVFIFVIVQHNKNNFHFNLNAFILVLFGGLLYIHESGGGLILALSLLVYFIVFISQRTKDNSYYDILKPQLKFFFYLSLISYFLFLFGLTTPFSFQDNGRGEVYLHYFLLSDFPSFEITNPNTWRFYAFLNEPGAAAAVSGVVIIKERFTFKGNEVFWLTILASFSTGIFVTLMASYLVLNFKKQYFPVIFILTGVLLAFYIFGANSSSLFVSYLHEKVFYFTYDFFSYKDDRLQFSFLNYLFLSPFLFFIYVLMLIMVPIRYIMFFILMGLYRHHFILNTIPFLLVVFYQKSNVDLSLFNKFNHSRKIGSF